MPPRIRLQPHASRHLRVRTYNHAARLAAAAAQQTPQCTARSYASLATAAATTPAPPIEQLKTMPSPPIARHPPTQPPSYKPPEFRKSQLLRQYASLLRSSPLVVLFQHNNLRAVEWAGIRRELAKALRAVDEQLAASGSPNAGLEDSIKIQTTQTGILRAALRVVEFYDPVLKAQQQQQQQQGQAAAAASAEALQAAEQEALFTHTLSRAAHDVAADRKKKHELEVLLSGPVALLTFPAVSPQHLKAALSILAPSPEFPAPRRKQNPDYHEPAVQSGLQKLMLLGARVEGKTFDFEGARWIGGIEGGLDGLRAQLVYMLQGFGAQLTNTLEGASRSLYFTMESRRLDMEDKEKPKEEESK